jgi:hypothetical protein
MLCKGIPRMRVRLYPYLSLYLYLYLIIKYVRFLSSTIFFRPFCPPTKSYIISSVTGKLKKRFNLSMLFVLFFEYLMKIVKARRTEFGSFTFQHILIYYSAYCTCPQTVFYSTASPLIRFAALPLPPRAIDKAPGWHEYGSAYGRGRRLAARQGRTRIQNFA